MKPHEETWEVFEANKGFPAFAARTRTIAEGAYEVRVFESLSGEDDDIERAKLAAQAPAMARLLLKIEWNGGAQGDSGMCPSCFQFPTKHAPDCELATVLRAAGVLA